MRCSWDCSKMHQGGSRLVNKTNGDTAHAATDWWNGDAVVRVCTVPYCTAPEHPDRTILPRCCEAEKGALVEWGAECSKDGKPMTLF